MMKKSLFTIASITVAAAMGVHAAPEVGQPAPDFTLNDCHGNEHTLSDYQGQFVVLEWINHGCPFVVKHYATGNMQNLQRELAEQDVVWLSICSSAPGTQGHMSAEDAAAKCEELDVKITGYLLDEDGTVGKLYGARVTPEMYIINPEGVLIYAGAIDDDSSSDHASVETATNYVSVALTEAKAGEDVSTPQTRAYGCTVKYAR